MKLARISRIVKILTTLQSGQLFTADELADLVQVSKRTVYRDLNELEAIGIPFTYNSDAGGYRIEPEFFLPSLDLNLQEALSLLLLVHKGRSHLPLPFKNSALMAGMKIENNLPDEISDYCSASLSSVSIRPDSHAPMDKLDNIFSVLQMAVRNNRKVKINYFSLYDGGLISLTLEPYHIFYNYRAWYVTGKSLMHDEVRTFKLNRIKKIVPLKTRFLKNKKFDIHQYLGLAWSMIPEGKIYNIQLKFTPKVTHNVCEVIWHKTQKVSKHEDGSATVQFRVDGLGEISWWILGYGDQVEILQPKKLKDRIRKVAEKMVNINRK